MAICAVPDSVATASVGHGTCTLTQSQSSYHSASPGPSARRPSSCFDDDTEEANVCANFDVAVEHAHARASAVTTDDDNDDDANVVNFTDILGEIFDAPFTASSVLNLDLALAPPTPTSTSMVLPCSIHSRHCTRASTRLSSFFCCCREAHLRSRSFQYHNHLFPLLVAVL